MDSANDFRKIKLLGDGSAGEVYLVENVNNKLKYAMKTFKNKKRQATRERDILLSTEHPFIIKMIHNFQDGDDFYLFLTYCECGDLYEFMMKRERRCFGEKQARYYSSCILLALEYLHSNGIVYRDLKLENILICSSGRILLSDFDLSSRGDVITKNFKDIEFSEPNITLRGINGTPEYLAPEIVNSVPYTCIIDWWAFGVLIYEMLYSKTPFFHDNVEIMFYLIKEHDVIFPHHTPQGCKISDKVRDLINDLLKYKPDDRLGFRGGAPEIKEHLFFKKVDFKSLHGQIPPIIPRK
jgi:protein-serine/threonine kinase